MEELSNLSPEELAKRKAKLKSYFITIIGFSVLVILLDVYVVIFRSGRITAGLVIPLIVILLPLISLRQSWQSIDREIGSRKADKTENH